MNLWPWFSVFDPLSLAPWPWVVWSLWPWVSGLGSPGVGSDTSSGLGFVSGCVSGSVSILWPGVSDFGSLGIGSASGVCG